MHIVTIEWRLLYTLTYQTILFFSFISFSVLAGQVPPNADDRTKRMIV